MKTAKDIFFLEFKKRRYCSGGSMVFLAVGAGVFIVANCFCVGAAANDAPSSDGADVLDGLCVAWASFMMGMMRNAHILSHLIQSFCFADYAMLPRREDGTTWCSRFLFMMPTS